MHRGAMTSRWGDAYHTASLPPTWGRSYRTVPLTLTLGVLDPVLFLSAISNSQKKTPYQGVISSTAVMCVDYF